MARGQNRMVPQRLGGSQHVGQFRPVQEPEAHAAFPEQIRLDEMPGVQRHDHPTRRHRAGKRPADGDECLDRLAAAHRQIGGFHAQHGRHDVHRGAGIADHQHLAEVATLQHPPFRQPGRIFRIEIGQRHRRHPDPYAGEEQRGAGREPHQVPCGGGQDRRERAHLRTGNTGTRRCRRPTAAQTRRQFRTRPPREAMAANATPTSGCGSLP